MNERVVDYYVKGLSIDVRQSIFEALREMSDSQMDLLLERDIGYRSFRSWYYTDQDIEDQINMSIVDFKNVNEILIKNGRYPLFPNPEDAYGSAKEYKRIMKKRTKEELLTEFGCTWQDYIPYQHVTDEQQ